MPPWYIEKDIGIQHYKNDISLSDDEIAKIAWWADNGAPRGNPADMPPPLHVRRRQRLDDRHAGPRRLDAAGQREGRAARTGGAPPALPTPASRRIATSRRSKSKKSTTRKAKPALDEHRRRAVHLPSRHHGGRSARCERRGAASSAAGRCTKSDATPTSSIPDAGKLLRAGSRVGFPQRAHAREREGHDRSPRDRVQVPPEGLPAEVRRAPVPIGTGDIDIRPMEVGPEDRIVP